MNQKILYIFTRTPLHVGAGSSVGAIDQPVIRERHTGFPVIPGSSIKGVLADGQDYLERNEDGRIVKDESRNTSKRTAKGAAVFGLGASKDENDSGKAGLISFGEAQLLAFPVRSARGCFAWLTSPLTLKRWQRLSGITFDLPPVNEGEAYFDATVLGGTHAGNAALFEDYLYAHKGSFGSAQIIAQSIPIDGLWKDLAANRLAYVSDETLAHFCQTACEVAQHVVIDDETGTAKSGLLFNQENVPAETLFFSALHAKNDTVFEHLTIPDPIQLGGDATTGLGFCSTLMQ